MRVKAVQLSRASISWMFYAQVLTEVKAWTAHVPAEISDPALPSSFITSKFKLSKPNWMTGLVGCNILVSCNVGRNVSFFDLKQLHYLFHC